ncbi:RNA ligase [Streptomyces sp. NPDC049040]|uniref:RNA ligase n=1 Tax=Streptomyces sp. NPDC049040 TaxID=3365593 RepID=UPI00371039D5
MRLCDLFDPGDLEAAVAAGHVTRRAHPELPISVLTYTRTAQYEAAWTPVTTRCRGLIADDTSGEIVAWPFGKFFNAGEHGTGRPYAPPLPDEPFEVYDKVDGSLGIVFHHEGRWRAASKGSFTGEQALWAQAWLDGHDTGRLTPGTTYLAEVLYPENRIVVDYGGRRDMVLLAAFDAAGREIPLRDAAGGWEPVGSVVRTWPAMPLADLLLAAGDDMRLDGRPASGTDAEGWVLRFASGIRVKVKLDGYVRLHRVLTGITERDIWRYAGMQRLTGHDRGHTAKALGVSPAEIAALETAGTGPLDALLAQVPDEFDAWVRSVVAGLEARAEDMTRAIRDTYRGIAQLAGDRGGFARAARQATTDPSVHAAMFRLLNGKSTDLLVWRAVRPAAADPFRSDGEG